MAKEWPGVPGMGVCGLGCPQAGVGPLAVQTRWGQQGAGGQAAGRGLGWNPNLGSAQAAVEEFWLCVGENSVFGSHSPSDLFRTTPGSFCYHFCSTSYENRLR